VHIKDVLVVPQQNISDGELTLTFFFITSLCRSEANTFGSLYIWRGRQLTHYANLDFDTATLVTANQSKNFIRPAGILLNFTVPSIDHLLGSWTWVVNSIPHLISREIGSKRGEKYSGSASDMV
jgi:hypothetical protein